MPIVFSYRNIGLVPLLNPIISYEIWDQNNSSGPNYGAKYEGPLINHSSSDPYLQHSLNLYPLNLEGTWLLAFHVRWTNCFQDGEGFPGLDPTNTMRINMTNGGVIFTTKGPSKQIDLVAATSNQTCAAPAGMAINITSTFDTFVSTEGYEADLCPVVESPPTEADSCAVTIGAAAASSIAASMTSTVCSGLATDVPDGVDCSSFKKKSGALRIVPGGATCLAFMLGALGFIL
ncbi:hypothetical protein NW767_009045 [Fusarium falciforme]|nr:hypothetical protein NW767_009045 [Fusarium falciforme]